MNRGLRVAVVILALAGSLALLPYLGLPYHPLRVTALRLNLYDTPTPTPTTAPTPTPTSTPEPVLEAFHVYLPVIQR